MLVDSSSVNLTWDELSCPDQNGPLLAYVISYTPDGETASTSESPVGNNHQLTELTPCTRYTLMIAAQNGAGIGDFSPSLSVITSGIGKADARV